jgi:hypothetical protein
MKNAVFWDVMSCGSLRTDASEESFASIIKVKKNQRPRNNVSSNKQLKHVVKKFLFLLMI